jgi:quaternary ammonium compound-resistance protein SugE
MAWIYLLIAGALEIGWPVGLKISQAPRYRVAGLVTAALCMTASGLFLWLAQRQIPIGTAYAVWTGIGTVGTFAIGILVYRDPATAWRLLSALLIVIGIIGLKLSHQTS